MLSQYDMREAAATTVRCAKGTQPATCRRWLQALIWNVALCVCLAAGAARADGGEYRLAVFELESDELRDQFADLLAQRVRNVLDARSDYALHDTRVSLVQLSLAQNCNTSESACLTKIAKSLQLDGFVFGKVTHEGGAPVALLRRYDAWSESVDRSAMATFSGTQPSSEEFERASTKLLDDLLGPEPSLAARAELNVPAVPQLPRPDRLEPVDSGISGKRVAGFALLGGAVLSTGLSVLSFLEVGRAEKNRDYERYRLAVGQRSMNVRDVCDEAEAGRRYGLDEAGFREAKSACNRGMTFEILQFVFIGSAVVSGGLAAYFLTSGNGPRERPTLGTRTFSLHPTLARRGFGVGARVKF